MVVVFLAGVLPKQYLHDLLFHHRDTVHPLVKDGELIISGKHIHCSFLGFVFGPFVSSQRITLSFHGPLVHTSHFSVCYSYRYYCMLYVPELRGPPTC